MAEAAAARQQAEYDRIIADENQRRKQEAEEGLRREQIATTKRNLDMTILTADKMEAIADAKLKANCSLKKKKSHVYPSMKTSVYNNQRTQEWIRTEGKTSGDKTENVNTGKDKTQIEAELRSILPELYLYREFILRGFPRNSPPLYRSHLQDGRAVIQNRCIK